MPVKLAGRFWPTLEHSSQDSASGQSMRRVTYRREPGRALLEVGLDQKTAMSIRRCARCSLNRLHIRLEHTANRSAAWLKWFETLKEFPPLHAPASYNLAQVMEQIKAGSERPSD